MISLNQYSKRTQYYSNHLPMLLEKYIARFKFHTLLDAGSGDGALLYALNKAGYLKNKTVFAIDLSWDRLMLCQKINPDFKCFISDTCRMPSVPDGSIDVLISSQVIEHVIDEQALLREAARVLNQSNNLFYLSTVFKKWYGWHFYRLNHTWVMDPTHLREYTTDNELFNLLNQAGFKIIESQKTLFWFSLGNFILRTLGYSNNLIHPPLLKLFTAIKIPALGYYHWEIVCEKPL